MGLTDNLAPLHLQEAEGETIELGTLWMHHPVVLVWLRHYG